MTTIRRTHTTIHIWVFTALGGETLKGTRQLWLRGVENLGRQEYLRGKELLDGCKGGTGVAVAGAVPGLLEPPRPHTGSDPLQGGVQPRDAQSASADQTVCTNLQGSAGEDPQLHLHPITNAVSEGLNSRIQSLKASARGSRSFANYRINIPIHLGGLDMRQ